jgi:hypothetical protein
MADDIDQRSKMTSFSGAGHPGPLSGLYKNETPFPTGECIECGGDDRTGQVGGHAECRPLPGLPSEA